MPIKIGLIKIKGGEIKNILSYQYHYLLTPPPLAPPPSPLIAQLFGPNVPILWQAERPIRIKKKKKSSKCRENMQDGAIVHLMEDGAVTQKVLDDHVTACAHTPDFQREQTHFIFWIGAAF